MQLFLVPVMYDRIGRNKLTRIILRRVGYSPRGVCNQGLVAFLVVTPSRAGCKLTALLSCYRFWGSFRALAKSAGWLHVWRPSLVCSSSPLVPNRHTNVDNGEGKEGGGWLLSAPPLASTFAPLIKTGFTKIFSFCDFLSTCRVLAVCVCVSNIN